MSQQISPLPKPEQTENGLIIPSEVNNVLISLDQNEADSQIFESLKLLTESSESVNNRRQGLNNFFLSFNTLLMGSIAALLSNSTFNKNWTLFLPLLAFALVVNWFWRSALESYRIVSESKIVLSKKLEARLSVKVFTAQYLITESKENKYMPLTKLEKDVAMAFIVIYAAVIVGFFTGVFRLP